MKRLLAIAALAVCMGSVSSIVQGHMQAPGTPPLPQFEVATIKPGGGYDPPNGHIYGGSCHGIDSQIAQTAALMQPPPLGQCRFSRVSLSALIARAFEEPGTFRQVKGGPDWACSAGGASGDCPGQFDIQAKAEDPATTTQAQLRLMLQSLLADRFKLQFHMESGETQGFAMLVAKNGAKVKPAVAEYEGIHGNGLMLTTTSAPLSELARSLAGRAGGPVIDRTALAGNYSFTLSFQDASIFTMLQDELGLRLEAQKVPIDSIVIDHAEKPLLQ